MSMSPNDSTTARGRDVIGHLLTTATPGDYVVNETQRVVERFRTPSAHLADDYLEVSHVHRHLQVLRT